MQKDHRKAIIETAFKEQFDRPPEIWTRAPGRVDLMGSHTDYNQGFVMTMSIDRDTWIAARARQDQHVTLASLNLPGVAEFDSTDFKHDATTPWSNYIRGMIWAFRQKGHPSGGFDALIHSTIPFAAGLSSSAALEMATAILIVTLNNLTLSRLDLALLGQQAENHYVGVNSGILDQYSSVMGEADSAILLDCRALTSQSVAIGAGLQIVICDTNAKRSLIGSAYDDRRSQCEQGVTVLRRTYPEILALRDVQMNQLESCKDQLSPVVYRRCQFIVEENTRCLDLVDALQKPDHDRLHQLFSASYVGARDLYEITNAAMDAMQTAMIAAPGVIAARQTGAGFGGCMIALVSAGSVEAFSEYVSATYFQDTGILPDVYPVTASAGADLLDFSQ